MESPTSELKSCGFLIYRRADSGSVDAIIGKSFLLMRHADRWDLPKGHMDQGESEIETALRELDEETGIAESNIRIDRQFRFEHSYTVRLKKFRLEPRDKTLVVFLAELLNPVDLHVTEHSGYDWFSWQPPHLIQAMTIDPLLDAVARHWKTTKPETAL